MRLGQSRRRAVRPHQEIIGGQATACPEGHGGRAAGPSVVSQEIPDGGTLVRRCPPPAQILARGGGGGVGAARTAKQLGVSALRWERGTGAPGSSWHAREFRSRGRWRV